MSSVHAWGWASLGEVADTALGKMLDRGRSHGLPHVEYLRNVNVQWGRIDTSDLLSMELADGERDRFGVRTGDLLVCEGGEVGRAAIWTGDSGYMAYQKALHRVRPHARLESRFLRYYLEHAAQSGKLDSLATGSTIRHLPQQQLRRLLLPLPPVDEQRRIVDILEDHLSRLDSAVGGLERSLRRVEGLERSHIARMLAVPAIELTRVGDVLLQSKGGWSRSQSHLVEAGGVPYLKMNNITSRGRLDTSKVVAVHADAAERVRFGIRAGDVLFNSKNSAELVGKTSVATEAIDGWLFNENIIRLRFSDWLVPEFVGLWFRGPQIRAAIKSSVRASTNVAAVYAGALKQFPIWVPGLETQAQIVKESEALAEGVERLARSSTVALSRTKALRRALLMAAFSGKLTGAASDADRIEEFEVAQ